MTPMTQAQYDAMNRLRSADGLGPFCGSYAGYLRVVAQHNANVKAA